MRKREEIEDEADHAKIRGDWQQDIIIRLLLDIRELLIRKDEEAQMDEEINDALSN